MGNGYGYHTRLSDSECIEKFDKFLRIIKRDYNFLWGGSPSLISEWGKQVEDLAVDSGKQLYVSSLPWRIDPIDFSDFGIVRKFGTFNFYMKNLGGKSLITNSQTVYTNLKKQFDLNTNACFNDWACKIKENVKFIVHSDIVKKMKKLEEDLK